MSDKPSFFAELKRRNVYKPLVGESDASNGIGSLNREV
jgi:hypothetical protein